MAYDPTFNELALQGISARRLQLQLQSEELDKLERELKSNRPVRRAKSANGRTYRPMPMKMRKHLSRLAKARWAKKRAGKSK